MLAGNVAHKGRGKKLTLAVIASCDPGFFEHWEGTEDVANIEGLGRIEGISRIKIDGSARQILSLYHLTRGAWGETAQWPDGRALLDQPAKLIEAFHLIDRVKARYTKKRPVK